MKTLHPLLRGYFNGHVSKQQVCTEYDLSEDMFNLVTEHFKRKSLEKKILLISGVGNKRESYFENEMDYATPTPSTKSNDELIRMFNNRDLENGIKNDFDMGVTMEKMLQTYHVSENYINEICKS